MYTEQKNWWEYLVPFYQPLSVVQVSHIEMQTSLLLCEITVPKQSHGIMYVYLFYSLTSSTNINSNYCMAELWLKLAVY